MEGSIASPLDAAMVGDRKVRPRLILALMLLASVIYTVDRMIPVIIAEQVKTEFALTDTELGLFTGFIYGLSFGVSGLLCGPLIDRYNRIRLLSGMLALWSGLTAVAALAASFWQLVTLRFFVGAAEGGGSPATLSILSDVFPPEKRGTAIGIYKMGTPLGYFSASAGCGYIASEFGWREAVLVAGIPGMLLALAIIRCVPNIGRGVYDKPEPRPAKSNIAREVIDAIAHRPGLGFLILGLCLVTFANLGVQAFLIPFFSRVHAMPLSESSFLLAIASGLGGLSPLLLGLLNDRLVRAGPQWSSLLASIIALGALGSGLTLLAAEREPVMIAGLMVWQALVLGISVVVFAGVVTIAPPSVRGTILAILLTGTIFFGMGVGPVVVGKISDLLGGGTAVREASMVVMGFNLLASVSFLAAARQISRHRRSGTAA